MSLFLKLLVLTVAQSVVRQKGNEGLFGEATRGPSSDDWCYDSQKSIIKCLDPSLWKWGCLGSSQSPINIVTQNAIYRRRDSFRFSGYDKQDNWVIKNNGHTVTVDLKNTIKVSGGGLKTVYRAVEFHFHWSNTLEKGSEHTIDGKAFAMEMQIIHVKDKFQNFKEAVDTGEKYAIAVMGFMVEASNKKHEGFETILDTLDEIPYKNDSTITNSVSLYELIPKREHLKGHFQYMGSLTFPECAEGVIWTVFKKRIQLHNTQILQFSKKIFYNEKGEKDMPIIDNFRPIQKQWSRPVFHSRVGGLLPHTWPMFLTLALTYLLAVFLY